MHYLRISTDKPIPDGLIPSLSLDHVCDDEDSTYYPDKSYEYYASSEDDLRELTDDVNNAPASLVEESGEVFYNRCISIYGALDALNIKWVYDSLGMPEYDSVTGEDAYKQGLDETKGSLNENVNNNQNINKMKKSTGYQDAISKLENEGYKAMCLHHHNNADSWSEEYRSDYFQAIAENVE